MGEGDRAVDGADEDVRDVGEVELGVAIGVAIRKITVAVGVATSVGESIAIGIAVSIRMTIAVGEAIPFRIAIRISIGCMGRQIPIGMLPCPRSWQIFVIRSIEINRILYNISITAISSIHRIHSPLHS